jgi:hypothetical protein
VKGALRGIFVENNPKNAVLGRPPDASVEAAEVIETSF